MTKGRFRGYELRTKDVAGSRAFYGALFGEEFWGTAMTVSPLPAPAAARDAPSHWLGLIGTTDVEHTAGRMVELGGQRLGPTRHHPDGSLRQALRDPWGAVVGVGSGLPSTDSSPVAWHFLHTTDRHRAFAAYADLFGWAGTTPGDVEPDLGGVQVFAWTSSGTPAGCVANTALQPHTHTHWLFYFRVGDIAASLARARALGATVLSPFIAPDGAQFVACDDPQGAAFGLYQAPRC